MCCFAPLSSPLQTHDRLKPGAWCAFSTNGPTTARRVVLRFFLRPPAVSYLVFFFVHHISFQKSSYTYCSALSLSHRARRASNFGGRLAAAAGQAVLRASSPPVHVVEKPSSFSLEDGSHVDVVVGSGALSAVCVSTRIKNSISINLRLRASLSLPVELNCILPGFFSIIVG